MSETVVSIDAFRARKDRCAHSWKESVSQPIRENCEHCGNLRAPRRYADGDRDAVDPVFRHLWPDQRPKPRGRYVGGGAA